jgi:hypothetical protein
VHEYRHTTIHGPGSWIVTYYQRKIVGAADADIPNHETTAAQSSLRSLTGNSKQAADQFESHLTASNAVHPVSNPYQTLDIRSLRWLFALQTAGRKMQRNSQSP